MLTTKVFESKDGVKFTFTYREDTKKSSKIYDILARGIAATNHDDFLDRGTMAFPDEIRQEYIQYRNLG